MMLLRSCLTFVLELFYGPLAPLYPWLTHLLFGRNWHEWRRSVLPWIHEARTIADIGCGPGDLAVDLATPERRVLAIDRSRSMLHLARRRLSRIGKRLPIAILCADARALPIADSSLDAVVMTFPTAVVLDPRTHAEIARVLRPGGTFVTVVAVSPKEWPWWLRPCSPLLRRLMSTAEEGSAYALPLPGDTKLVGQWIRTVHPSGTVYLWVAQRVGPSDA